MRKATSPGCTTCSVTRMSFGTTSGIRWRWRRPVRSSTVACRGSSGGERSFGHVTLVSCERPEDLTLLALRHTEGIERARKDRRHFVELGSRDPEIAVGFLEAERGAARPCGAELERSAGDLADPQGAHELEAGKASEAVRVPLAKGRVGRSLTDDRVLDQRIAEVVHDGGDREHATQTLVETRLCHGSRSFYD